MSSRDDWVPVAAGVVVGAGLLALLYKMFSGRAGYTKTTNQNVGASKFVCTCKKGGPNFVLLCTMEIFAGLEGDRSYYFFQDYGPVYLYVFKIYRKTVSNSWTNWKIEKRKSNVICHYNAEELDRRRDVASRPIPPLQSETWYLCGWGFFGSSSPDGEGGSRSKAWMPILGGTTVLGVLALLYKNLDKLKALLWRNKDPCETVVEKRTPPVQKIKICDCKD